jgi:hypothetical protein
MRAFACAALFVIVSSLAAASDCRDFDVAIANRLIAARTIAKLDAANAKAHRDDLPLRALYRSRRLELNPTREEEDRYIAALPRTRDELFCMYRLTEVEPIKEELAVSNAVYGMFDTLQALAHKRRVGYDRLLHITLWTDGDLAESAWTWYQDAFDGEDHDRIIASIRRLAPADQRQLCGGSTVASLSAKKIAERCAPPDY